MLTLEFALLLYISHNFKFLFIGTMLHYTTQSHTSTLHKSYRHFQQEAKFIKDERFTVYKTSEKGWGQLLRVALVAPSEHLSPGCLTA